MEIVVDCPNKPLYIMSEKASTDGTGRPVISGFLGGKSLTKFKFVIEGAIQVPGALELILGQHC